MQPNNLTEKITRTNKIFVLLATLLATASFSVSSYATMITLGAPSVGSALNQGYGWGTIGNYLQVGVNDGSPYGDPIHGALEFDLSALFVDGTINSATINLPFLHSYDQHNGGTSYARQIPMDVHTYVGNGVITSADLGINNYLLTATDFSSTDVTAFVQSLVDNSDQYGGFMFRLGNENRDNVVNWFGYADDLSRFRLEIDFAPAPPAPPVVGVPEPTTLVLLGLGLTGLGFSRRKRTQ